MEKKKDLPIVLFNASVILAGLKSSRGGSVKLLGWSKRKQIKGLISEIILDEAGRHADKIGYKRQSITQKSIIIFHSILPPPTKATVEKYKQVVVDHGDAHLLASAKEVKAEFLVTLDKKHLLTLQKKIKWTKIVSPGQLIEALGGKMT